MTTDDSWNNHWREGPNALLGMELRRSPVPATGARLSVRNGEQQQFTTCQVQKTFQAMCLRAPANAADRSQVAQITADFVSSNYNLKTAFAESAVYCMGQ